MASQLLFRGNILEIEDDITFNFQVSDVGDMSASKSNYTSTFKIPRTHSNVSLFEGLGIPSDVSTVPYVINNVQCMQDFNVIYDGTLIVLKSDRYYYHCTVISGTYDFFKALGETTFGDLDLPELRVNKTTKLVADNITSVSSSREFTFFLSRFSNNPYFEGGLNIDQMPIAVKLWYLIDKLFDYAGINYSFPGNVNIDIGQSFYTFPYPQYINVGELGAIVSDNRRDTDTTVSVPINDNLQDYRSQYANWDTSSDPSYLFQQDGFDLIAQQTGEFMIVFPKATVESYGPGDTQSSPANVILKVNGNVIGRFTTLSREQASESDEAYRTIYNFTAGDRLRIEFDYQNDQNFVRVFGFYELVLRFTIPSVSDQGMKEIYNTKLSDFIKELMYRYALVPFQKDDYIVFTPISELYDNVGDVTDWSEKYNQRLEETYDIGYAQNNYIRHSYVNDGDDYFDLNLRSNNDNLPVSKDILTAKSFAASLTKSEIFTQTEPILSPSVFVRDFLTYEVAEDFKVKAEKRNYFVKIENNFEQGRRTRLTSGSLPNPLVLINNNINVGIFEDEQFIQNEYWLPFLNILQNTRMIIVELNLNFNDIKNINLENRYFFAQESAHFVLSKLQYKRGELSKGTFIKLNY